MRALIIGGNRFVGKKLAMKLIARGIQVTLLNRQTSGDGFGSLVTRIKCDRSDAAALGDAVADKEWDVVYDQVCFEAPEARVAAEILAPHAHKYLLTSSQSVYGPGNDIKETKFEAKNHSFRQDIVKEADYGEAKRQAEAVLTKALGAKLTVARLPLILGPDDWTGRLQFHLDRVRARKPIFVPNQEAQISFVSSEDAATALAFLAESEATGAFNIASPEPVSLGRFLGYIEKAAGRPAIYATAADEENTSPYGIEKDWWMNVEKLTAVGFSAGSIDAWLPATLRSAAWA